MALEIAKIDFAEGLRTKNITVPPMPAVVDFADPPPALVDAAKKDKLVVQNIAVAVYKQLNDSKTTVQKAILDFDGKFRPSGDKKTDDDAVATFNTVCAQICRAQEDLAETVAAKKWSEYVARNKEWTKFRIKFACKVTATTIGLALSITSAALSGGTAAVAVIGMAAKVYTLGKEIYEFAKDISKVEATIVEVAGALAKKYSDPTVQKMNWRDQASEVAGFLGVPFVQVTAKLEDELKKHKAKLGQLGGKAEDAWSDAKELMKKIEQLETQTKGTQREQKVKTLGAKATELLDRVASLNGKVEEGETFNETMTAMNEQFKAKRDPKLGPLGKVIDYASDAKEAFDLAKEVVDFAKDLAH